MFKLYPKKEFSFFTLYFKFTFVCLNLLKRFIFSFLAILKTEYKSEVRNSYEIPNIILFLINGLVGAYLFPKIILEKGHHQNYKVELCEYLYGLVARK